MKYSLTVDPPKSDDELSTGKCSAILESPSRRSPTEYDLWDRERKQMLGIHVEDRNWEAKPFFKPSCIPISLIFLLIVLVVLLPLLDGSHEKAHGKHNQLNHIISCSNQCSIQLVESIPEGLVYPNTSQRYMSTFEAWDSLIKSAEHTIEIGSFYWTLRGEDVVNHSSSWEGDKIFNELIDAGVNRGIEIKIAQSMPSSVSPNVDTEILAHTGAAKVRSVDFPMLLGGGVLHTKVWIVDRKHFYVGSANMDWRSLTQVKELGAMVTNCTCLANDIVKIFEVYWRLGEPNAQIPSKWPEELSTSINITEQMEVGFNNIGSSKVYLSSSPPSFSPTGRTQDIDAIVKTILDAEEFVYVSVMDYIPMIIYVKPWGFWPAIDDALRKVALEKKVRVKLLISHWSHSRKEIDFFLKSLVDISEVLPGVDIEVRRFIVPATPDQQKIPFGRVNHNKYMVTDKTAYIGTSNWSGDYFINTAGIGFVLSDTQANESQITIRSQLVNIFERDWHSPYAIKF